MKRTPKKRLFGALLAVCGLAGLALAVPSMAVEIRPGAPPISDFAAPNSFSGYSTGTDLHAALLNLAGGQQVVHANVAFSGASTACDTAHPLAAAAPGGPSACTGSNAVDPTGPRDSAKPEAGTHDIRNEMGDVVQPALPGPTNETLPAPSGNPLEFVHSELPGTNSFGKGSGLEVGLGTPVPDPGTPDTDQIIPSKVQVSAPPQPAAPKGTTPITESPCRNGDTLCHIAIEVPASQLAYGELIRSQAMARWPKTNTANDPLSICKAGTPYGEGYGRAGRVQLLSQTAPPAGQNSQPDPLLSTDAPATANPIPPATSGPGELPSAARGTAQSYSNERLVNQTALDRKVGVVPNPNSNGNLALQSESRQTIAPISLLWQKQQNLPGGIVVPAHPAVTIEVAGEWVLQAVAGGVNGSAYVKYGPDPRTVDNQTPVVRVIQYSVDLTTDPLHPRIVGNVSNVLTLQDVVGQTGLKVNIPPPDPTQPNQTYLLQLTGGAPHKIGDRSNVPPDPDKAAGVLFDPNGQWAGAAVDALHVALVSGPVIGGPTLVDAYVGHMESRAQVANGGVSCPLPVLKTSDKGVVLAGDRFTYTITVSNPYDCDITHLSVIDNIAASDPNMRWSILGTAPAADSISPTSIVWKDVGALPAGGTKALTISIQTDPASAPGRFTDTVLASGPCVGAASNNLVQITGDQTTLNLTGRTTLNLPFVVTTPPERCPPGTTGTPPNCVAPPPIVCPAGTFGIPPNCLQIQTVCPAGTTGVPPNCVAAASLVSTPTTGPRVLGTQLERGQLAFTGYNILPVLLLGVGSLVVGLFLMLGAEVLPDES